MSLEDAEFLVPIYLECRKLGHSADIGRFRFGEEDSKDVLIIQKYYPHASWEEIKSLVKRCVSEKYFLHVEMGSEYYVKFTDVGFDIAKKQLEIIKINKTKNIWLKTSDLTKKYSGIFTLLTAIVAVLALVIAILK